MKTLSLSQQTEYHFATGLLESTHPEMIARIKEAISSLAGMLLQDDLEIAILISGTPKLLEPFIGKARALAERRDNIWLAGGLREFNQGRVSAARRIELPPTTEAALNKTKTKSVAYQLKGTIFEKESDNFGKIWRIYDPQINVIFYPKTLQNQVLGKSIAKWRNQLGIDKK